MRARSLFATITICLAGLAPGFAESVADAPLTIERIMARDWIGTPPEDPYWSDDGKSIYYRQLRPGSDVVDLHRVELASGRTEVVQPAELGRADAPGGSW